jgi:hypothetical protein
MNLNNIFLIILIILMKLSITICQISQKIKSLITTMKQNKTNLVTEEDMDINKVENTVENIMIENNMVEKECVVLDLLSLSLSLLVISTILELLKIH